MKKLLAVLAVCSLGLMAAQVSFADEAAPQEESEATAISSTSYNAETKILTVVFEKRGTYEYTGVPAEVNEALEKAESKGAYFNANIRGKYESKKVS